MDEDRNYVALDKKAEAEMDKPSKLKDSIEPVYETTESLPSNSKATEAELDKPSTQEVVAEVNSRNHYVPNPDRNSMRRSPSYNQAVDSSTDNDDLYKTGSNNSATQPRKRYKDGKYYVNVDTEDTGEV